jgi:hypothetical protein
MPMNNQNGIVLLKGPKQLYAIKTSENTEYSGVTVEDGLVFWEIEHRYEIKGKIEDSQEKPANKSFSKNIAASHVKYLGPPPYIPDEALEKEIVSDNIAKVKLALT